MRSLLWSRIALVVALLGLYGQSSFAIVVRDDVSEATSKALAANKQYQAVGQLAMDFGTLGKFNGSATLISPDWILTAGHCVEDWSTGVAVNAGPTMIDFTIGGTKYTSNSIIVNPGWTASLGDSTQGYDIALVHLNKPVTGITPAPLFAKNWELGKQITYVGYGNWGIGTTGQDPLSPYSLTKHAADNMVGAIDITGRVLLTDFDNPKLKGAAALGPLGVDTARPREGNTANGDSGGGMFIVDGTQYKLAGVISYGTLANAAYGDVSGNTRVSAHLPWIMANVPNLAKPAGGTTIIVPGYPPGGAGSTIIIHSGVAAVPEPATWALLLVSLVGVLMLRRR